MSDLEEDCKPALDAVASADNVTTQKKKMSPCSLSEGMTLVIQNGRKHIVEAQVQNDGEGGFRKPEENLGISRVERSNRMSLSKSSSDLPSATSAPSSSNYLSNKAGRFISKLRLGFASSRDLMSMAAAASSPKRSVSFRVKKQQQHHHHQEQLDEQKDNKNKKDKKKTKTESKTKTSAALVLKLLQQDYVVGYCGMGLHADDTFQGKHLDTGGTAVVMFMSPEQRDRFARHPHTIVLDVITSTTAAAVTEGDGGVGTAATAATTVDSGGLTLLSGLAMDARGEATPVFHAVAERLDGRVFAAVLRRLTEVSPAAAARLTHLCCHKMTPAAAEVARRAATAVFSSDSKSCDTAGIPISRPPLNDVWECGEFHRRFEETTGRGTLARATRKLLLTADAAAFDKIMQDMTLASVDDEQSDSKKFLAAFGPGGRIAPPDQWAVCRRADMLPANFGLAAYRRRCRRLFAPGVTANEVLAGVHHLSTFYARKEVLDVLEGSLGRSPSAMQECFRRCHVEASDYQIHQAEGSNLYYVRKITNLAQNESDCWRMVAVCTEPLLCNPDLCQVRCPHCRSRDQDYYDYGFSRKALGWCAHKLRCTCETYVRLRYCSHLHVVTAVYGYKKRNKSETPLVTSAAPLSAARVEAAAVETATDEFKGPPPQEGKDHAAAAVDDRAFHEVLRQASDACQRLLGQVGLCRAVAADHAWLERVVAAADMLNRKNM